MIKALDRWLIPYLRSPRRPRSATPVDMLVAITDHFEPFHRTDKEGAMRRMRRWADAFPRHIEPFRDVDDCRPKHTFFFPIEQYDADVIDSLADLCRKTGSEVEVHLHHDGDTAESLREKLEKGKRDLIRHGLLACNHRGETVYGFIHGDWALDNSHPSGRHCGVPDELGVLKATGCFADFTMPSAPSPTQARTVNSLYYAQDTPEPRSHDRGRRISINAKTVRDAPEFLTLVQGPLGFNWRWRKFGLIPRIENGDLTGGNPPTAKRLSVWLDLGIQVEGRPDTVFVKLHTHGAVERNSEMLLGEPMRQFHELVTNDPRVRVHYVTAREMVNILHSLEDNVSTPVGKSRDYLFRSNVQFR